MSSIELVDQELLTPDDGAATAWPDARERFAEVRSYWLATAHPAGWPQVRPLLGVLIDDRIHVCTSPKARKGRNLEHEPRCTVTATCRDLDMVVEGAATHVTGDEELERVTAAFRDKYGWPVTPAGDGTVTAKYSAPTAGKPPYHVYRITPATVFGFPTGDGFGPMRWRFRIAR